jgi:hypothetical protein
MKKMKKLNTLNNFCKKWGPNAKVLELQKFVRLVYLHLLLIVG